MTIEELKYSIDKFKNNQSDSNGNYYPLIAVEYAIKGELIMLHNFFDKLEDKYGITIKDFYYSKYYIANEEPNLFLYSNKGKIEFFINDYVNNLDTGSVMTALKQYNKKDFLKTKWKLSDEDTEEFLDIFIRLYNFFGLRKRELYTDYNYVLKTNIDLNVLLSFNLYVDTSNGHGYIFEKVLSDSSFEKCEMMNGQFLPDKYPKDCNFYYTKTVSENSVYLCVNNNDIFNFLNEELIGKISTDVLVDVSSFSLPFQERIKYCNSILKLNLEEERATEIENSRNLERRRIMQFYNKFSELAALINNTSLDMDFKKIKFNELEKIIFKSYGLPNALGYIEFEDFFKNNMVLRMLDLATLDLTNVDIRGIDFSGTNIHINPQVIYNKDMTNVNATNVKFSPFFDSFDDTILDGTIINDHEANINLDKVRSYNENTHITNEVIVISLK